MSRPLKFLENVGNKAATERECLSVLKNILENNRIKIFGNKISGWEIEILRSLEIC